MLFNVGLLTLGVVFSQAAVVPEPITLNYHKDIGIPEAARIKAAEEAINYDPKRIVGGSPSGLGRVPYQAGLIIYLTNGATSICGASLLTNNALVTAAHCWSTPWMQGSQLDVVLGSTMLFSGGTRIPTFNVVVHANYNMITLNNDIAMIGIWSVSFTNNIQPIALPTGAMQSNNFVGSDVVASGFGLISDSDTINQHQFLSHVVVPVITNEVCAETYGTNVVGASTICTSGYGGRGTCGGDSGGPVAYTHDGDNYLVGIISFISIRGCESGFPSGHTRVTSFIGWIQARL